MVLRVPPSTDLYGGKVPTAPSSTPPPGVRAASQLGEGFGGFVGTQSQAVAAPVATPLAPTELQGQGMQAQCALLFTHLTKELNAVSCIYTDKEYHTQKYLFS
jgi:hypothetical protein